MAGLVGTATQANITVNTGPTTCVQLVAASNHRVKIRHIDVTLGAAVFCDAVVVIQSDAGTATSLTPVLLSPGSESLQTTAQHTATSEPTTTSTLFRKDGSDRFEWWWPPGEELQLAGGSRLGVIVTSASSVGVTVSVEFEE